MIFSRKRDRARSADEAAARRTEVGDAEPAAKAAKATTPAKATTAGRARRATTAAATTPSTGGPFDVTEAPDDEYERLDLGALRIPVTPEVEVRVQADQEGQIQQVMLVSANSGMQLGVFAAPRTEPIWDEVRQEINAQLRSDGFTATERDGEFGTELLAKVMTPEGPMDLRFVGVSGPRWLVRVVFQGAMATDVEAAPALMACLRGLVVDRGKEAMPVRESLPLRLPKELAAAGRAEAAGQPGAVEDSSQPGQA